MLCLWCRPVRCSLRRPGCRDYQELRARYLTLLLSAPDHRGSNRCWKAATISNSREALRSAGITFSARGGSDPWSQTPMTASPIYFCVAAPALSSSSPASRVNSPITSDTRFSPTRLVKPVKSRMSATRTVTYRAAVISTVGLADDTLRVDLARFCEQYSHRYFADSEAVSMAEPSPGAYSDVIDECSVAATCVGDIAVIAGLAVDDGMFSRYRRIFQHDCVLSAATDAADTAEFDGNRSCALRTLNFYARDYVRHRTSQLSHSLGPRWLTFISGFRLCCLGNEGARTSSSSGIPFCTLLTSAREENSSGVSGRQKSDQGWLLPSGRRTWSELALRSTTVALSFFLKSGVESVAQESGGDLSRDYQHRERLGNDKNNADIRAHFLRILSMAFPLASSSTSLSK